MFVFFLFVGNLKWGNLESCRKKRGHQPTGVLVHAAKANGFASVSDMLHLKDSKKSGSQEPVDVAVSSKKRKAAEDEVCFPLKSLCAFRVYMFL